MAGSACQSGWLAARSAAGDGFLAGRAPSSMPALRRWPSSRGDPMQLATSLIVLSCILAAGATISSVLASLPRYRPQRKRLTLVVILCALLAAGASAAKEILAQPFQSTNGPNGPARMATSTAFDAAIEKLVSKARAHFEAAEDDFKSADYVDAAEEYRRSIAAVPTLPAYLTPTPPRARRWDLSRRARRRRALPAPRRASLGQV